MNRAQELKRRVKRDLRILATHLQLNPIEVKVIEDNARFIKFERNESHPVFLTSFISLLESDFYSRKEKLKICIQALDLKSSSDHVDQVLWRILGSTIESYLAWSKRRHL